MISRDKWQWFGSAGHFICADACRFHMLTTVGAWMISTVGEMVPDAPIREILAEIRKIKLEGKGDARRADYINKIGYEEIGAGRTYETMVFPYRGAKCECGCGMPRPSSFSEVVALGYMKAKDARAGHLKLCQKYACKTAR